MRCDAHAASSAGHHHRAADDDYVAIPTTGHHRRLSSGRLSNVPSSGSLHSLVPPHSQRASQRRSCRLLLVALTTVLGLQLLAHALFPVASPLPAIAEGITSLGHSAALLAHTTHFWADHPVVPHPSHDPTTAIPRTLHLVGVQPLRGGVNNDPACAMLGDSGWTVQRYTEAHGAALVHRNFPEYDALYRSLAPWPAQRMAVLRLLVLLRHGGVALAAGLDCHRGLDTVLLADDRMVVGWDTDGRTVADRLIAAAPGHPVLSDAVQRLAAQPVEGPWTLSAHWTAAVLGHSASNRTQQVVTVHRAHYTSTMYHTVGGARPARIGAGPWRGGRAGGVCHASCAARLVCRATGRRAAARGASVWSGAVRDVQIMHTMFPYPTLAYTRDHFDTHRQAEARPTAVLGEATASLFRPVALPWQPPFTLLLPPAGRDDEVSRQLLQSGTWQPGRSAHQQHPHPLSALLDALVPRWIVHAHNTPCRYVHRMLQGSRARRRCCSTWERGMGWRLRLRLLGATPSWWWSRSGACGRRCRRRRGSRSCTRGCVCMRKSALGLVATSVCAATGSSCNRCGR